MLTDRVIYFAPMPSFDALATRAARYAGDAATVREGGRNLSGGTACNLYLFVKGRRDTLRGPLGTYDEPSERIVEVFVDDRVNVITRDADPLTMSVADGLAHVLRDTWNGRMAPPLDLASLFRALRECALCKRIATRRSAKTYRQGGFQFRCDTHSEPGENWIDLPHASILRRYDV